MPPDGNQYQLMLARTIGLGSKWIGIRKRYWRLEKGKKKEED